MRAVPARRKTWLDGLSHGSALDDDTSQPAMRRCTFEAEEGQSSELAACGEPASRGYDAGDRRNSDLGIYEQKNHGEGSHPQLNCQGCMGHLPQNWDDVRIEETRHSNFTSRCHEHASQSASSNTYASSRRDAELLFDGSVKHGGENSSAVRDRTDSGSFTFKERWFNYPSGPEVGNPAVHRERASQNVAGPSSEAAAASAAGSSHTRRRARSHAFASSCNWRACMPKAQWLLRFLMSLTLLKLSGGWISVSNEGYSVKHQLIAQAGIKIPEDFRINGLLLVKPVATLQCNPSRRGALRWNSKFFEACDGETNWRPVSFCSRKCDINTQTVPCGLPVRNRCDVDCKQTGTGLNMRQCMLGVGTTECNTPVVDNCGNACGLLGMMKCREGVKDAGEILIRSLDGVNATAQFSLTVGKAGSKADSEGQLESVCVFLCRLVVVCACVCAHVYTCLKHADHIRKVRTRRIDRSHSPARFMPTKTCQKKNAFSTGSEVQSHSLTLIRTIMSCISLVLMPASHKRCCSRRSTLCYQTCLYAPSI